MKINDKKIKRFIKENKILCYGLVGIGILTLTIGLGYYIGQYETTKEVVGFWVQVDNIQLLSVIKVAILLWAFGKLLH